MNDQKEKIEKAGTFFRFEDLRVYHKSLDYVNWLQDVTMLFPDNNSNFVNQYNASARNIAFFIAEGSARNKVQFITYLKMAKSAIRECLVFTTLSHNQNNISDTHEEESRMQLMEMTKMIGALISSLQRSMSNNGNNGNNTSNYRYNAKTENTSEQRISYDSVENPASKNDVVDNN